MFAESQHRRTRAAPVKPSEAIATMLAEKQAELRSRYQVGIVLANDLKLSALEQSPIKLARNVAAPRSKCRPPAPGKVMTSVLSDAGTVPHGRH